MHNFRQLQIWQEGMSVAKSAYLILKDFPSAEKFGHFLSISSGSLFKLETQLQLSIDLNFLSQITSEKLMLDIVLLQKKISTFKKTLL